MFIKESRGEGLVSVWWYTSDGEFWDFSIDVNKAENDGGFLQYSTTKNHLNLWRLACDTYITDVTKRNETYNKGYKSIERGRVIYNLRTQCYEVICSKELVDDVAFKEACIKHFNLSGNRVDFQALNHYHIQNLTGNPSVDKFYFDY